MTPSKWVRRFAGLVPANGPVLDLAAGGGRHSRLFRDLGHPVTAVDRDITQLLDLAGVTAVEADLEGQPWPITGQFAGVIVTNYLHRPIPERIVDAVASGGALIYETFAAGNEACGKPSRPAFLLQPGELLHTADGLEVVAYEHGRVGQPRPAVVQRICAVRASSPQVLF